MSIAVFLLLSMVGADPPQVPSAAQPPPVDDIVVNGVRGSAGRKPRPDAVQVLRDHCFEPARRTRHFDEPSPGGQWFELDEKERRQFQIGDPAVPAYAMDDEGRDQHLWLKFEHLEHKGDTVEQRCTLLVIGGRDHKRFVGDMSNLFHGGPTQRHVGQRDGSPAIAGWEQWLWTGMPSHGSKSWSAIHSARGSEPGWIVVVEGQDFYNSFDYIMGDMKTRTGPGTAVTMLTFSLTARPGR
jgi:hypothetical protein